MFITAVLVTKLCLMYVYYCSTTFPSSLSPSIPPFLLLYLSLGGARDYSVRQFTWACLEAAETEHWHQL